MSLTIYNWYILVYFYITDHDELIHPDHVSRKKPSLSAPLGKKGFADIYVRKSLATAKSRSVRMTFQALERENGLEILGVS